MQKIIPPTECPSCNGPLVWEKDQLFCKSSDCESKNYKKVEHFAKTMKIKGLGPSTISKLDIQTIDEIYLTSLDTMEKALGQKIAVKLFDEIERSKKAHLNEVLPSLGIPLVGKTASEKICTVVDNIYDITLTTCQKAGLGPKVTENLLNWINDNDDLLSVLPVNFSITTHTNEPEKWMGTVCISGRLRTVKTKADAKKMLEAYGYKVIDNLTKEVTILLNESGISSTKTTKAQNMGIEICTDINQLLQETK